MSMRNKYNYKLQECYVCHSYAELFAKTKDILEKYSNITFKVDDNISILSPMNKGCYNHSYLVKQCKLSGIQLLTSNKVFNVSTNDWSNLLKIEAIIEMLEKTNSKYSLILDGKDTCICKDIDKDFINKFKEYNADIVYNCTPYRYPNREIEPKEFIEINNFKYINAGVCIGYTDKLLQFYKECLVNITEVVNGWDGKPSEQYVIRKTVVNSSIVVRCDYNNTLFNYPK